jgi:hypothetical protein
MIKQLVLFFFTYFKNITNIFFILKIPLRVRVPEASFIARSVMLPRACCAAAAA